MKYKVEIDGEIFEVTIQDVHAKPVLAEVNGKTYQVWPEAEATGHAPVPATAAPAVPAAEVQTRPAAPIADGGAGVVNAPLPGVIISIEVKAGEVVKAGQELLVLEAMKMKNSIKASRDGVVAEIFVNPGDLVRHNQPLLSYQA